ncbi:MAG: Roadblock/LC7 family protein [Candidatus Methanohalarchaeum thermophilum]|uniref:Roadblock/LC7 family protein n=1 Tax=Methanohalarchaeum thermophilum TaxID=1903181 RepID=A0A1Q6DXA2_METT1|nr:MAG: Roadblock/LC7 family protein [Candidatus Methanohalarchaeum thermophilum]
MKVDKLNKELRELSNIPGVKACILYRLDGEIIQVRIPGDKNEIIKLMKWMKNQVKYVINEIKKKNLDSVDFSFDELQVVFYPSSQSTVLAVVTEEEAHRDLIKMEAIGTRDKVNKIIT